MKKDIVSHCTMQPTLESRMVEDRTGQNIHSWFTFNLQLYDRGGSQLSRLLIQNTSSICMQLQNTKQD